MGLAIALGLRRLRGLRRVAWYRLAGRWPRYRHPPADGPRGLVRGPEAGEFCRLALSWQRAAETAPEPAYPRRPR